VVVDDVVGRSDVVDEEVDEVVGTIDVVEEEVGIVVGRIDVEVDDVGNGVSMGVGNGVGVGGAPVGASIGVCALTRLAIRDGPSVLKAILIHTTTNITGNFFIIGLIPIFHLISYV